MDRKRFEVFGNSFSLEHKPFPGLLEKPLRYVAIEDALKAEGYTINHSLWPVTDALLSSVHEPQYVALLRKLSTQGAVQSTLGSLVSPRLQYYCRVSPGSYYAVMASVGSCLSAFHKILWWDVDRVFVLARPPGHHASTGRGEGFCLVNNVAVVAKVAIEHGMRVAVVDFDRHHGNGTEEILSRFGKNALFVSSFQEGCKYARRTVSENSLRVPIPGFSGDDEVCSLYEERVIPSLVEFAPDIILVSAGFDMCDGDPLTNLRVTQNGYAGITRMLVEVANRCCKGRVLSVLEGGYDPSIFMSSVLSHVSELSR